ncbi:MAG: leucine-rich repeat protein [Eubacterium sp.]|nr:leucine-rich repeat protein [Eubacterium sp.]
MKSITKKMLAVLIVASMIITLFPGMGVKTVNAAEETVISEINIVYDLKEYHFNTAFTEKEADERIKHGKPKYVEVKSEGCYSGEWADGLYSWGYNSWNYIGSSTDYLSVEKNYAIYVNAIKLKEDYVFPESIKQSKVMSGDITDIAIKVNGVERDDIEIHYVSAKDLFYCYIPIGKPSTEYITPTISLNGSSEEMEPGHEREFTAKLEGSISDRTVNWSLTGNNSTNTTITEGKLKIGADETATSVTVTATSAVDSTLTKSLVIPISYDIKPVEKVVVSPKECSVCKGYDKQFSASVIGEQANKAVIWSVSGQTSTATEISSEGNLNVGSDETASTLLVTATSVADPTKKDTATVNIFEPQYIKSIDIEFDLDEYNFNPGYTEQEVNERIQQGNPKYVGVTSEGCYSGKWADGLYSWGYNSWNYIGSSTDYLSVEKEYAIYINAIKLNEGYFFPESIKKSKVMSGDITDIAIKVNGVERDDIEIHYKSDKDLFYCYIPIGKPQIDIVKEGASVSGITDKTYDGTELTQDISVIITKGEDTTTLIEGTDYVVSYENNIEVGTATVTVKGIGKYSGVITNTFEIKAAPTPTPGSEPTPTPTPGTTDPSATPTPDGTEPSATPTPGIEDKTVTPAEVGTTLTDSANNVTYKVISTGNTDASDPSKNEMPAVAFTGTTDKKAKKFTIGDTVKFGDVIYNIESIEEGALKNNKTITSLTIGKNVKVIEKNAFAGCTKLKTVNCKSKVLYKIGANAFKGDKKLTKMTLKTSLLKKKNVGKNAIKGTSKKLKIYAPKKMKKSYQKLFRAKGNKKVKTK